MEANGSLQAGVVQAFTKKRFKPPNRRELGWEKPSSHNTPSTASVYASEDSYGHSGFTGTAVWVDPRYDLVHVFLSNRTYPNANNDRLSRKNVRRRIHDAVYESIKEQVQ